MLVWPGIRSVLPESAGTQNEWMTSAEPQPEADRLADRDVDLVGGGEAAGRIVAQIADLPPPLVARDLDRDAAARFGGSAIAAIVTSVQVTEPASATTVNGRPT